MPCQRIKLTVRENDGRALVTRRRASWCPPTRATDRPACRGGSSPRDARRRRTGRGSSACPWRSRPVKRLAVRERHVTDAEQNTSQTAGESSMEWPPSTPMSDAILRPCEFAGCRPSRQRRTYRCDQTVDHVDLCERVADAVPSLAFRHVNVGRPEPAPTLPLRSRDVGMQLLLRATDIQVEEGHVVPFSILPGRSFGRPRGASRWICSASSVSTTGLRLRPFLPAHPRAGHRDTKRNSNIAAKVDGAVDITKLR